MGLESRHAAVASLLWRVTGQVVTRDENAYVKFLKTALGSKAAKEPMFDFKGTNTNAKMFMKTAQVLENTGVHAYSGQALNIKSPTYLRSGGRDSLSAASVPSGRGRPSANRLRHDGH
jgi:hypothetical protein